MANEKRVIPEHIGKLMSLEDQKKYGFESAAHWAVRQEVEREKDLHTMFIAFLNRNEIGFYHAAMNKKSALDVGQPDFGCYLGGRIIFVEFKYGKGKLSPEQKSRIAFLLAGDNIVKVCSTYLEAVDAVSEFFGLKSCEESTIE